MCEVDRLLVASMNAKSRVWITGKEKNPMLIAVEDFGEYVDVADLHADRNGLDIQPIPRCWELMILGIASLAVIRRRRWGLKVIYHNCKSCSTSQLE